MMHDGLALLLWTCGRQLIMVKTDHFINYKAKERKRRGLSFAPNNLKISVSLINSTTLVTNSLPHLSL